MPHCDAVRTKRSNDFPVLEKRTDYRIAVGRDKRDLAESP